MRTSRVRRVPAAIGLVGGMVLSMGLVSAGPAAAATAACSATNVRTGVKTASLGAALAAAAAGDTIDVRGTCTGNFTVTVPLTLYGAGPNVTLSGGGSGTVLTIDVPSGTVNVEFLKITGGSAVEGGGISADAGASDPLTLGMAYDRITGDKASFAGGGLYAGSIAALNIQRSAFTSDTISPGTHGAEGSAIVSGGQIDIYDSNIIGNQATAAAGATVLGGAMYLTGPAILNTEYVNQTTVSGGQIMGAGLDAAASLSMINSQVAENTARTTTGAISGAGIYAGGSTLQIKTANIGNNTATTSSGAIRGVGIDLGASTPLNMVDGSVSSNRATTTSGAVVGVGVAGGGGSETFSGAGILDNAGTSASGTLLGGGIDPGAPLNLSNGLITGNSLSSVTGRAQGGGIWSSVATTVNHLTVSNNKASTAGGGVFLLGAPLTIVNSSLTGDTAVTGGAIDNSGGSVSITHSLVTGTCVGCT